MHFPLYDVVLPWTCLHTVIAPPSPSPNNAPPGILYADVGVDLSAVPLEDYPILGLFSRVMMETGTSEMDRVKLSRRIGSQTGGVYCTFLADQPSTDGAVADPGALKSYLFLRGKVMFRLPAFSFWMHHGL